MSIKSLVATGTKVWLDSIDPELVAKNYVQGASGATSNPIIIADLLGTGRFDNLMTAHFDKGLDDKDSAWAVTDQLVSQASQVFLPVWKETKGDNGYVSFELDPLLEDLANPLPVEERTRQYVELAKHWGLNRDNRMIKIPATPAGLAALEEVVAAGIQVNVTLIFTRRQYIAARDAVWKGAQRRPKNAQPLKSVYSIFVSRVDVYTAKHAPDLSPAAQGMVGIVNAKLLWQENQKFWADKGLSNKQEIIFASTGTKDPSLPPDKYVEALAGSDIQTNPPATNEAVERLNKTYTSRIAQMPPKEILDEIKAKVLDDKLEDVLMKEGLEKFADPQKKLLAAITKKRSDLVKA